MTRFQKIQIYKKKEIVFTASLKEYGLSGFFFFRFEESFDASHSNEVGYFYIFKTLNLTFN